MAHLCELCLGFSNWDLLLEQKSSTAKFRHHPTAVVLHTAARNGCHLCNLIEQALSRSRRPPNEMWLPNRQIWLQCHEAGVKVDYTSIVITIEPLSLATAGSRDVVDTGGPLVLERTPATERKLRGSMSERSEMFSIVQDHVGTRFFYEAREIFNQDLFWALLNPYHQGRLELAPIPGKPLFEL